MIEEFNTLNFDGDDYRGTRKSRRQNHFTQEFANSYWQIYAYVKTLVPERNDADDVMQEMAIVLWEKFDQFELGSSFTHWARAVAFRVARSFARQKSKTLGFGLDDDVLKQLAHVQTGTEELLELRKSYLNRCINRLRREDRHLLLACESQHGKVAEIARKRKLQVRQLYHKLDQLREQLARCVQKSLSQGDDE